MTRYSNVRLTRTVKQPWVDTYVIKRTKVGKQLMKRIGAHIKEGGKVTFETRYDEAGDEYADAVLEP